MIIKEIEMAEIQKGMYFDCQLENTIGYNISATLRLRRIKGKYLENAVKLIIKEQEMLRSTFVLKDGVPVILVHDMVEFSLPLTDVSGLSAEQKSHVIKNSKEQIFGQVFSLENGPLLRMKLLQESEDTHILLICCHHLICDGISMDLLKEKLIRNYQALSKGECIELKADAGYSDFIIKENNKLQQGLLTSQKAFWMEKMAGAEVSGLQPDYSMIPDYSVMGREKRFEIDAALFQSLEQLAMNQEVTLFSLCLAAFKVLMHKYTRNEEIIIASPFSNRPLFELEETIGCFVNMLPLRSTIQKDMSFESVVQNVGKEFIATYKNMAYPNNLMMRDSGLASNLGEPSVLDISFVYDSYDNFAGDGINVDILADDIVTFSGNLMVILNKNATTTTLQIQYNPSMYSDESIELIGKRYLKLLECINRDVKIKIDDIELFIEGEREQILEVFNQSDYFAHEYTTPIDIFYQKVKQHPEKVAVMTSNRQFSYAEINQQSNQLAYKILELKTKENEVIGIQLERSVELIISILAVLKAGCAYVPVDSLYPAVRKAFIFEDAEIGIFITDSKLPFDESWAVTRLCVDDETVFSGNDSDIQVKLDPRGLAYIEYTSGSTGNPKGVMIECHSLVNTVRDLERRFPVAEDDVYLFKTAFSFDVSGTEIYGWFIGAGSLFILDKDGEKNPDMILDSIEQFGITHINFVPSMFRLFLESLDGVNLAKIKNLKYIFVGGEAITYDLIRKFAALNTEVRLENVYGPTECTIWASHQSLQGCEEKVNIAIGRPLNETKWYVIDEAQRLLPVGVPGELCLSGAGLARGYLNREELTKDRFVINPFYQEGDPEYYRYLYKTGDLAKWLPDGTIEFMGRLDFQVKIRGVRLELGEIENALSEHSGIIQAVVVTKEMPNKSVILCAYYMANEELVTEKLREYLQQKLPVYMIPSFFVYKEKMPLNSSGKVNRNVLSAEMDYLKEQVQVYVSPKTKLEKQIAAIWSQALGYQGIGLDDNFFDKGGHSMALMAVHNRIKKEFEVDFSITKLFKLPTIRLQADYLETEVLGGRKENHQIKIEAGKHKATIDSDIAIVGMAVNVPGADNLETFWDNLQQGKETIHYYSEAELRDLQICENIIGMPNYVRAKGRVAGIEEFDPEFFGYSPVDVKMMSPQLRLLYKGAWTAFEDAGYYPDRDDSRVGVFLGGSDDFKWYQKALFSDENYSDKYQAFTMGTNHFLATRLAYKFNLRGPVYTALTGCSTSLVTVHLAAQSLMLGDCDMALAGGITIEMPNEGGYLYEDGMMFSPDGHCRPFDNEAKGTVFSNGMGLVVLKRLEDAVKDQDRIYAVIKGSAINNDGNQKVGYAAPSVDGQVDVVRLALARAGIEAEEISYVEAHGTGTLLGDPIEVESLTTAFNTEQKQFCTLGSVKGNIGHTDTAAGVIGLAKAALSLHHKFIPGTVNYNLPNHKIDFQDTPFVVEPQGKPWLSDKTRYAAINSFGIGGTNAHLILAEGPALQQSVSESTYSILPISGRDADAVNRNADAIISFIEAHPDVNLDDVAWTLQTARKGFAYRKALTIAANIHEQSDSYRQLWQEKSEIQQIEHSDHIYFMFPGQGSQYQGMGRELYYEGEQSAVSEIYQTHVEQVLQQINEVEKAELLAVLFGHENEMAINQTQHSQLALFLTEYALAKTMIDIGIKPKGFVGHSIGEVTAAAVAGVWSLRDAVKIVKTRGKLMQQQQPGVMVAVMDDVETVRPLLVENTWIALKNTTKRCVIAGTAEGIRLVESNLTDKAIKFMRVRTSHAFHTEMMAPAAAAFEELLKTIPMNPPKYPLVSNVSGTWATAEEITKPEYWAAHIVTPVDFEGNLAQILSVEEAVYLEVGAGKTLSSFAGQHQTKQDGHYFVNLMRHPKEKKHDVVYLNDKLGELWSLGVTVDWQLLNGNEQRCKVSLPSYQFKNELFPIDIPAEYSNGKTSVIQKQDGVTKVALVPSKTVVKEDDVQGMVEKAFYNIFGFKNIKANQDFFDLGGDSLKAVSLCGELKDMAGIKVAVKDIFDNPTMARLTTFIQAQDLQMPQQPQIVPVAKNPAYPLSSAQMRMFSLHQLDPLSLAYNLPSVTRIYGELNKDKFEAAINKLVQRHESLRTHFTIEDNQAVQVIDDSIQVSIQYEKGSINRETDVNNHIKAFVQPFQLDIAPLFRVKLIEGNQEEYLLLFDVHHIVADGTSVEVISRDFNTLYTTEMEPPAVQYKDYAVWENNLDFASVYQEQRSYWLDKLNGELPVLELPTDYERPRVMNHSGGRLHFELDKDLSDKISKLASEAGATMYMTLLSAWNVLLGRYSGQEDVIVGSPTAGRYQPEIKETVGMFVNMLPMRNNLAAEKTFLELLQEVKENALSAFKNQDYQFDRLVEDLKLKRELNRGMLFDVCFDYQNMDFYQLEAVGLTFEPYDFDTNCASYDLVLTCQENREKNISGFLDYSKALYKEETAFNIIEHFKKILEQVTDNAAVKLGAVSLISERELAFIEHHVNNTRLAVPKDLLIQELFEANVAKMPDKIAVTTATGLNLSYRELNERANVLAHTLLAAGVEKDELVGFMPQRDEYLLVAQLGILKAGAAYVPIDSDFPAERVEYMLEKSQARIMICPRELQGQTNFTGKMIDCAELDFNGAGAKKENIVFDKRAEQLACTIFTSGSTGQPKGVQINHTPIVNFIYDIKTRGIFANKEDKVISVTTISFDIFGFESLTPLCTGHSIYLADKMEQLDPALAAQKIIKHQVTHILSTVSRIKVFVDNKQFEPALKQLTCVLSGGENFPLSLLKDLQYKSNAKVFNMYGPTETTIWSTTKELTLAEQISIGTPIANTNVYIMNEYHKLQPIGVFGELCIGGHGLARGYLGNPQETNQKFIYVEELQQLVYRTGDKARLLPNGEVEIIGRLDSQVKIRGYRIELDEIEKVAIRNPLVNQSAVIVHEDGNGNKQLILFYNSKNPEQDIANQEHTIKKWLEKQLPHYMVPSRVIRLAVMPCLPNGKLNRKALKVPDVSASETARIAPVPQFQQQNLQGTLTAKIQQIWAEVLELDSVGVKDNFFDKGGNSLSLILVNNKLNELLEQPVQLIQLFENPTIESLVNALKLPETSSDAEVQSISNSFVTNGSDADKMPAGNQDIAIIGMACRFPGAPDLDSYWQNIMAGRETIIDISDDELKAAGIPDEQFANPDYVKRKGVLEGAEYFDANFFGYSAKEATLMDPQMRLLHECAWQALDNGGCNPEQYSGNIGLFAGSGSNILWMAQAISANGDLVDTFEAMTLNEKDFLTTKISYKLNLTGPSMNVQSACSTSLVALHQGIEAIQSGAADMALAGGVCISYPRKEGYLWHKGMIFSKDGHCRPFSDDATGTVSGNGCGMVLLKPLHQAEQDNDNIYAVIKGSAINNDGLEKVGYTAPSIKGQSKVIKEALKKAAVSPEQIVYLEAHGTGTELGDPIEIEAVKQAWNTNKRNYCSLGSVKANIGHLDAAAGIAGFIKAVLIMQHKVIPPLVNYHQANPRLQIEASPFYISKKAEPASGPLYAGVSSFGIGGTNAHVIIGSYQGAGGDEGKNIYRLLFSGETKHSLNQTARTVLQAAVRGNVSLADLEFTLQCRKNNFAYRKALVLKASSLYLDSEVVQQFFDCEPIHQSDIVRWENEAKLEKNHPVKAARKVSLPAYVFEQKEYPADVSLKAFMPKSPERSAVVQEPREWTPETIRETVATLWMEALGCDKPKNQDTLFDLEGHSLTAIALSNKIKELFGADMLISDILDHPEFGYMVDWVCQHYQQDSRSKVPQIVPVDKQIPSKATSAQKRMYIVQEMATAGTPYNLAATYLINGELDKIAFKNAFEQLIDRHEALRTGFTMNGDEVYQAVADEVLAAIVFADGGEKSIAELVQSFVRPFDLAKPPLIRAGVYSYSADAHVFILDIHHIVADQSSLAILMKEFQALYRGQELTPLKLQYRDFANWQNQRFAKGAIEKQIQYWKDEFAEPVTPVDIADFKRSSESKRTAAKHCQAFSDELCQQLNAFAKQHNLTPFMLSFAAFKILLWKYSGETDLVVGTGSAGRTVSEVENIVGMFVNTLAVRSKVDEQQTVMEYFDSFKKKLMGAYENQEYPFEELVQELGIETELNRNPLFDIMFNYVNMGTDELVLEGLELTPWEDEEINGKFDITLTIAENAGHYQVELQYLESLFAESTIGLLTQKWLEVLERMLAAPNQCLQDLSFITTAEQEWILNELNDTATAVPCEYSIVALFQEMATKVSGQVALRHQKETMTYAQLDKASDKAASKLFAEGVGYQSRVALLLERGINQIVTMLAVLKCGAIYVPIDPEYPSDRIKHILTDSGSEYLIASQAGFDNNHAEIKYLSVADVFAGDERLHCEFTPIPRCKTDTMYIIYTSGSTGLPKGTLITDGNVVRVIRNTNYLNLTEMDCLLQLSNYAFDGSVFDIYGALLNGAELVLVDKEVVLDMGRLTALIKTEGITVMFVTAALFNMMVDADVETLRGMKAVLTGGEAMSLQHARKALAVLGPNHLFNVYGPTETTVFATYYPIAEIPAQLQRVPIGKAIANTTLYVLDKQGNLLPPGLSGELCIGGKGVALGYLNRPDLNQEKFIQLKFGSQERVYKTGDRVKMLADGNIEFLGRTDFQVKIRGFRIEPGEVEKLIQDIAGIKEVIVIAQQDAHDSLYLAAYYTVHDGAGITADILRSCLLEKVPEYLVPDKMIRLAVMPLNHNGKIDRKALLEIRDEQRILTADEKPGDAIQQLIIEKMQDILDKRPLGIFDNFFKNGGQSIKAIALCRALAKEGITLKVNELFQNPTAHGMSLLPTISKETAKKTISTTAKAEKQQKHRFMSDAEIEPFAAKIYQKCNLIGKAIRASVVVKEFDFSAVQKLHHQIGSDSSGFMMNVDAELDEAALRKILTKVIANNQLLHSSPNHLQELKWCEHNNENALKAWSSLLAVEDLRSYDEVVQQHLCQELHKLIFSEAYQAEQMPWKLCLLRLADYQYQIIWGVNHLAFDGMSAEIIKQQIEKLIAADLAADSDKSDIDVILNGEEYSQYVEVVAKGPQHISAAEIIEQFSLPVWQIANQALFKQLIKQGNRNQKSVQLAIPFHSQEQDNLWWYTFEMVRQILSRYSGFEELPIALLDYGRKYGDYHYYNCIGEFLDIIPVLMKAGNSEAEISEQLQFCSDNGINFLTLAGATSDYLPFAELQAMVQSMYQLEAGNLKTVLFNFQGYLSEHERQAFAGAAQDGGISQFLINAFYDEQKLYIEFDSSFGFDKQKLDEIITEIAGTLVELKSA